MVFPRAFGSGPSMSIPHMERGQKELKLWRLLGGVRGMSVNSWHRLHLFAKSKASTLSVGQ